MGRKKHRIDPFNYGHWRAAFTAIQVVSAVGGVIAAVLGEPAGLLGLGALFGGPKGTLIGSVGKQLLQEAGVPTVGTKNKEEDR